MVNKKLVAVGVGAGVVVAGVLVGRKLLRKAGEHPPAPSAIDLGFAKTAADAVAAQKGLHPDAAGEEGQLDRLRYFFLHRRALTLGLADESLRVAPGLSQLQQRMAHQLDLVGQFVAPLLGTSQSRGPYFGGAHDPGKPLHHLDLGFHTRVRELDAPITSEADAVAAASPTAQQLQTLRELDARKQRTLTIVWRAAALEPDAWSGTGDAAALRETELRTLLDRRLRSVERLHYEVSAGVGDARYFQGTPANNASNHAGPWFDGFVLHAFEHPSLPRTARSDDGSWDPAEFIAGVGQLGHRLSVDNATAGSFRLVFDGQKSPAIPANATADQVRDALRQVPTLAGLQVECKDGPLSETRVRIVLSGPLQPGMRLSLSDVQVTGPGPDPAQVTLDDPDLVFEVETRSLPRFNLDGSSTFGLPFNPRWYLNHASDEFDWNEWPGTRVRAKPWGLSGAMSTTTHWKLVPEADFVQGYGWMLVPPAATQVLSIKGIAKSGTFKLTLAGETTGELVHTATAWSVKKALAALPSAPKVIAIGGPLPEPITLYLHDSIAASANLAFTDNTLVALLADDAKPEPQISPPSTPTGDPPGQVIDDLFTLLVPPTDGPQDPNTHQPTTIPGFNRNDWWNRSWLHADGVMAALHLEALRFALMRSATPGPGLRPDDEFNALPWQHTLALDDCLGLRRVTHPPDSVMGPGRNAYFDNDAVELDDVQVGDQVLFSDSPVLTTLGCTAWDYPTLLVTDVDTSPDRPAVNLGALKVQGFGTDALSLPDFQLHQVGIADAVLKRVQAYIPAEIARLQAEAQASGTPFTPPTSLPWNIGIVTRLERASGDDNVLRLWNPYGDTWDGPGPWWIWVNVHTTIWHDALGIVEPPVVDGDTNGNGEIDGDEVEPPPPEIAAASVLAHLPGALVWVRTAAHDADSGEPQDDDTGTNPHANTRIRFADFPNPWRATGASPLARVRPDFKPPPIHDSRDPGAEQEDSILIPLFQPMGGWESYFEAKVKTPQDSAWPSRLDPVTPDARWFTGLATPPGDSTRIRVIRPRAKPAT